jgi:hypothetical protein
MLSDTGASVGSHKFWLRYIATTSCAAGRGHAWVSLPRPRRRRRCAHTRHQPLPAGTASARRLSRRAAGHLSFVCRAGGPFPRFWCHPEEVRHFLHAHELSHVYPIPWRTLAVKSGQGSGGSEPAILAQQAAAGDCHTMTADHVIRLSRFTPRSTCSRVCGRVRISPRARARYLPPAGACSASASPKYDAQ